MKILDVYKKYSLTPLLQLHQIRAGAVGKLITDNWNNPELIDPESIIQTLLLHDMGNIIKFDLENSPQLLGEGLINLDFWKNTQKEFIEKYGKDEHEATRIIGEELGVSKSVQNLLSQLKGVGDAAESNDYNLKICFYSDLRCGPFGILTVDKRFDDLIERYKGRNHPIANIQRTENNRKHTLTIEKQLQEYTTISLDLTSDALVEEIIENLKSYNLPTQKS